MNLKEWLQEQDISLSEFAARAQTSPNRAHEWAKGMLSAKYVARVQAITGGCVTALDFFPEEQSFAKPPDESAVANSNPSKRAKIPDE